MSEGARPTRTSARCGSPSSTSCPPRWRPRPSCCGCSATRRSRCEVTLLHMDTHESRNTPPEHLAAFYSTFDEVRDQKFDGLVITGAPVELLPFEEVDYWPELVRGDGLEPGQRLLAHSTSAGVRRPGSTTTTASRSTRCRRRCSGSSPTGCWSPTRRSCAGFDEVFPAPALAAHRGARARTSQGARAPAARRVRRGRRLPRVAASTAGSSSSPATPSTTGTPSRRSTIATWPGASPSRCRRTTFPDDDPRQPPIVTWRSHAFLLYANWLNHCVYQRTPFDLEAIPEEPRRED